MKVKIKDNITDDVEIKNLLDFIKDVINNNNFSEGKIENLDNSLDKVAEILSELINILAERKILTSDDITTLTSNYRYSKIRFIEDVKIHYIEGDATEPIGKGIKVITHICNNGVNGKPAWGAGFVLALSKKWKDPEDVYRRSFLDQGDINCYAKNPPVLGDVQFVQVEEDIWVANMIAQNGVRSTKNPVPIMYKSLHEALIRVADFVNELDASVVMPRIGTGLANGSWNKIEYIINDTLIKKGVKVFVYDLPKKERDDE